MSGADNPEGTNFWCQQKPLVTSVICYEFQETEAWVYTQFFMILYMYMYVAPRQEQTPLGDEILMSTETNILSLWSFVTSFKKKSRRSLILYTIFHDVYMYIAPGQGQTTPWGQNFGFNRKALSLCQFVASFQKISLNFYKCIFMFL